MLEMARKDQWRPLEVLCDEVETVKRFCYLGDRLNASGGCETAVTSRVRIGWMKFRECGELLRRRRFSLRMKGMVYQSCVRSAMLYGSETWCLTESEMAILRRTERAVVRSMCGVKLVDRKNTEELMEMLGLKKTLNRMAKANGVRWYGHVIRREDDSYSEEGNDDGSEWTAKARTAKNDMEKAGGRECEESRVEDGRSCRSNEMERRSESDRGGNEVHSATFGNEEKTELKLD